MTDQTTAERVEAVHEAFPDIIEATDRGGYLVASESQPGAWWLVQVLPGRLLCPCQGGQRIEAQVGAIGSPRFCRHGKRLLAYTTAMNQATARPVAAPAPGSVFVD